MVMAPAPVQTQGKGMNTRLGKWLNRWLKENSNGGYRALEEAKEGAPSHETVRKIVTAADDETLYKMQLGSFINLIRATNLSVTEFWDKVAPEDLRIPESERELLLIAARIARLPPEYRALVELALHRMTLTDDKESK